jgi:hypothetical protein
MTGSRTCRTRHEHGNGDETAPTPDAKGNRLSSSVTGKQSSGLTAAPTTHTDIPGHRLAAVGSATQRAGPPLQRQGCYRIASGDRIPCGAHGP